MVNVRVVISCEKGNICHFKYICFASDLIVTTSLDKMRHVIAINYVRLMRDMADAPATYLEFFFYNLSLFGIVALWNHFLLGEVAL